MSVQQLLTILQRMRTFSLLTALVLPLGPTVSHAQSWTWNWARKMGTSGLNDPFCVNPLNSNILYCSPGNNTIVVSRDRGRTWQTFSTVAGGNQIKAIAVSALDTSVILVAQEKTPPDRIMKSADGGATWVQTLAGNFYYWGHPLAYEPSLQNETVYTEASNVLYRSTNFGSTWDTVRVNPFNSNNQGWEDAFIRPDSGNVIVVSDNANGIWKSVDAGVTWRRVYSASGEVPAIALNLKTPAVAYGTKFGGGGGIVKTTDYGETWQLIPLFNGKNMWGVAVAPDDPNFVVVNTWGHSFASDGGAYVSRDGGATWERTYQGFSSTSNHALFILDTLSVFSLQGDGIYKLIFPGRIAGEVFDDRNGNGVRDSGEIARGNLRIRLSGSRTDSVLTNASGKYEFAVLSAGSYTVTPALPSQNSFITFPSSGSYSVTVTDGEQHEGRTFGIAERLLHVLTPNGGEQWALGDTQTISWSSQLITGKVCLELSRDGGATFSIVADSTVNDGTETWVVSGTTTSAARVRVRSLVYPTVVDVSDGTFTIHGPNSAAELPSHPLRFGLYQNYPNPFNPSTEIAFELPAPSAVTLTVFNTLGQKVVTLLSGHLYAPGTHRITFRPQNLSSGIYLYQLTTSAGESQTKKLLFLQ